MLRLRFQGCHIILFWKTMKNNEIHVFDVQMSWSKLTDQFFILQDNHRFYPFSISLFGSFWYIKTKIQPPRPRFSFFNGCHLVGKLPFLAGGLLCYHLKQSYVVCRCRSIPAWCRWKLTQWDQKRSGKSCKGHESRKSRIFPNSRPIDWCFCFPLY